MTADQDHVAHRLPTYLTRFVGRAAELAELVDLLGSARAVTICGVGGAGKTRLAIETAVRWQADGIAERHSRVFWVPLAAVADPDAVVAAVAAAVRVNEAAGLDPFMTLVDALSHQQALLLLDNCEQVAPACGALLNDLQRRCPGLTVLATSRTALRCEAERVFPLPRLGFGEPGGAGSTEAADLFLDRVRTVSPGYVLTGADGRRIEAICDRLDGLPLAIELVASWVRVLSVGDLSAELDLEGTVLSATSAAVAGRHRSLRSVLDSSWRWLGEEDRSVLTALGAFAGGFSRAAAEAVAGATLSTLSSLVEHALIQRLPDSLGGTRYHVHELVRSYAVERLVEGEHGLADAVRQRHCDFFVGRLEALDAKWRANPDLAPFEPLAADDANVHSALRWALDRGDGERAVRMAACLYHLVAHGWSQGVSRPMLEEALDLGASVTSATARQALAKTMAESGQTAVENLDFDRAQVRLDAALALYSELGDHDGVGFVLRGFSYLSLQTGELDAALDHAMRSLTLCRAAENRTGTAWSAVQVGDCALARGDLDDARRWYEEVLERFTSLDQPFGVYYTWIQLGTVHRLGAAYSAALELYRLALESQHTHYAPLGSTLIEGVGGVAAVVHEPSVAGKLFGAAEAWRAGHRAPRSPTAEADFRRARAAARRQLDRSGWDAATAAGRQLSPVRATGYASEVIQRLVAKLDVRSSGLTEREGEVVRLVAAGLSNAAIAERLSLSPRTVNAHLRSIFTKLGVTSRTAAVHEAAQFHLV